MDSNSCHKLPISNFDWILPIQGTFILSNGKWEHPNLELDEYVNYELNNTFEIFIYLNMWIL